MRKLFLTIFAIGIVTSINAQIEVNENTLNKGDVYVNSFDGLFSSNLDGDFSIVIKVDYDSRTMNATVIDNVTQKVTCLPYECNSQ
jgi:hypothetical protein